MGTQVVAETRPAGCLQVPNAGIECRGHVRAQTLHTHGCCVAPGDLREVV